MSRSCNPSTGVQLPIGFSWSIFGGSWRQSGFCNDDYGAICPIHSDHRSGSVVWTFSQWHWLSYPARLISGGPLENGYLPGDIPRLRITTDTVSGILSFRSGRSRSHGQPFGHGVRSEASGKGTLIFKGSCAPQQNPPEKEFILRPTSKAPDWRIQTFGEYLGEDLFRFLVPTLFVEIFRSKTRIKCRLSARSPRDSRLRAGRVRRGLPVFSA